MDDEWDDTPAPSGGGMGRGFSSNGGDTNGWRPGGGGGDGGWQPSGGADDGAGGGGYRGRQNGFGGGRGGGGGGGGGDGCRKCGESGHFARECPKGGGGGGGGDGCRKCGESGHFARECPNGGSGGGGGGDGCRKCGESGHFARECPNGGSGGGGGGGDGCRKCGESGHFARECPTAGEEKCRRCQQPGHFAKDCDAPPPEVIIGEDGVERKPVTYIPPDPTENESEMFTNGINSGINFSKYDKIEVTVSGENPPKHINSFAESGLRKLLLDNVAKCGYTKPTPVQKYALPIVMAGRDLMASAQTGSGKTAGFMLPILHKLLEDQDSELVNDGEHTEPWAVIVSPTRELTIQIFNEARKFSHGSIIKVCVAYGGAAVRHQADKVRAGCHVLVATPGRLMDFVNRGRITFSSIRFVVLDEADRMLDMGFLPEMEKLMNHPTMVPVGTRQTLMYSATFPEKVQALARKFLQNYIFLAVGPVGGANEDVTQTVIEVDKFKKRDTVMEILQDGELEKTLIFVETKRNADFLAAFLSGKNLPTTSIHGDREQREREEALRDFTSGRMNICVATGVAARGLDIKGVQHVINYDLPKSVDEFVHRIGRTGRVGNKGRATSFYDPSQDSDIGGDLAKVLRDANQEVPSFLEGYRAEGGGMESSKDIRGGGSTHVLEAEDEDW